MMFFKKFLKEKSIMGYYIFIMNLKIYLLDCSHIPLNVLLASKYISPLEKISFDKYQNEEVKKEKVASSILKNKYIGEYHIDEFGKPVSDSKYFNISHSHSVVVLIIDETTPIGIDIEKIRPVEDDLKNYISNESEKKYIHDPISFFEVWTNKEALVKAQGLGVKQKPSLIPGLPINGVREYQGNEYFNKTIRYNDYVISVSRKENIEFELTIIQEVI